MIADVCALFPDAPYFHACFDETQGVPEAELIAHANWCASEIGRHGKRMLMWVDMFKNHFGLAKLRTLSANIIPVEWAYGDPRPMVTRYHQAHIAPLGLAGYSNWGCHFPDFRSGKRNIDLWIGAARRMRSPGFGASIWGDEGYENSRDLAWNLYAYNAEASWTGRADHGRDFERRFEAIFYGRSLAPLRRVIEVRSTQLRIAPGENWRLFREGFTGLIRRVNADPVLARRARHDLAVHARMLRDVAAARGLAVRAAAGDPAHLRLVGAARRTHVGGRRAALHGPGARCVRADPRHVLRTPAPARLPHPRRTCRPHRTEIARGQRQPRNCGRIRRHASRVRVPQGLFARSRR